MQCAMLEPTTGLERVGLFTFLQVACVVCLCFAFMFVFSLQLCSGAMSCGIWVNARNALCTLCCSTFATHDI